MRPDRPPGRDAGGGLRAVALTPGNRLHTKTQPAKAEVTLESVADGADNGRACEAPGCGRTLPRGRRRFCSDLCRVRGQRAERSYDTDEFAQMVIRMIRSLARRVSASDLAAFGALWELRDEADRACVETIDGLRAEGFSWTALAAEAGQTRQGLTQWRQRRAAQSEGNDLLRGDPR